MPAVLSTMGSTEVLGGSQPTRGVKRSSGNLEDDGDRAAKYRSAAGSFRMPLERLGFYPDNRGGMGCSGYHVHEVAWDGTANKVKLRRYREVEIAAIPKNRLPEIIGHWKSLQR